jgi:hypothetical protein
MRKVLIISPHYAPSNLAAVHRSRLFAQHLPSFGWEPIILTVHENYYEEELDWNLYKLLPEGQRIEKVKAFKITKPRLVGDIGLRSYFQLRKRALTLVRNENIDFVYIPIPSFYASLIGPYLHRKTGVKYGLDYIDPWVHRFPGSNKFFSRHWWSSQIAKLLEPIAVKKASLITGVAEGYYKGVIKRNPKLYATCLFGAMPYGGDEADHKAVEKMNLQPYLFEKEIGKVKLMYAGAMLPKAYAPLEAIFKSISSNRTIFKNVEFHFIGTGKNSKEKKSEYNIKPYAQKYQLWNTIVYEHPQRIPYLDVLAHLNSSDGILILGSTEPHYTPSKTYQSVLSGKPIFAVLHEHSSAVNVIRRTNSGIVFSFAGEEGIEFIENSFSSFFVSFNSFMQSFQKSEVNISLLNEYSAKTSTEKLSELLSNIFD